MNYLILPFIIVPIVEIIVLIKVGSYIGTMNAVLIIIGTGVVGAVLTRIQGFLIIQKINTSLSRGVMPSADLLDGALVLVGGVCLLAPGFIGDAVGLLLLVPWTRFLIRHLLMFVMRKKTMKSGVITVDAFRSYSDDYNQLS